MTGVQTCALPIPSLGHRSTPPPEYQSPPPPEYRTPPPPEFPYPPPGYRSYTPEPRPYLHELRPYPPEHRYHYEEHPYPPHRERYHPSHPHRERGCRDFNPDDRFIKGVKVEAPTFDGQLDPTKFLDWVEGMDQYFKYYYGMSDERQVRFTKMKLRGKARLYWDK